MLKAGHQLIQKQSLQQRLSPQQIQYVKLLQLPTLALEQRVKEELEINPVLEEGDGILDDGMEIAPTLTDPASAREDGLAETPSADGPEASDDASADLDWEPFLRNSEYEADPVNASFASREEIRDLPNPYHESLLERLEQQVILLDLDDGEQLIAEQILGSLDEDGYFRRESEAVADNIAFNHGIMVDVQDVERVRRMIQRLDPVGIASRDLRDCLLVQLEHQIGVHPLARTAMTMLSKEWNAFEKKHFDRLLQRLSIDEETLADLFDLVRSLDPRPGAQIGEEASNDYIEPDFEVVFIPFDSGVVDAERTLRTRAGMHDAAIDEDDGRFLITLNQRNAPQIRISPRYKRIWDSMAATSSRKDASPAVRQQQETRAFIKEKLESAQWFLDSIQQRQHTLLNTMTSIVELQREFFRTGRQLRPMILKDIVGRISMDISTVSRVVNGKFVQTPHGVFELKYFFTEGIETDDGEEVSNREIKNKLAELIQNEDKRHPLSDNDLMKALEDNGIRIARRTVSKYREMLNIPVARLRREMG
jgi:RNA polymerase sigma-54 factor